MTFHAAKTILVSGEGGEEAEGDVTVTATTLEYELVRVGVLVDET